jgi:hypothetical protein
MEVTPFQDAQLALARGVFSFRQALRKFRKGVSASTHFIGARGNNFSNSFKMSSTPRLSRSRSTCLVSLHTLCQSAPIDVPIRFTHSLIPHHPGVLIRSSQTSLFASDAAVVNTKKRRQQERCVPHPSDVFVFVRWVDTTTSIRISFIGPQKNRRQEDRPLPPPVLTSTVFALCL